MRERLPYIWGPTAVATPGTTIPELEMIPFEDRQILEPAGFELTPIGFPHGPIQSYGFRTGDLAVVVDAKRIPDSARSLLEGVEVLVIRQFTTKKSGYHTKARAAQRIFEEGLTLAERVA